MIIINKKNAFTLIELLAVILILGIISLIAIPIISKIVETSKINSFKISINAIKKELFNQYSLQGVKDNCYFNDGAYYNGKKLNLKKIDDYKGFVNVVDNGIQSGMVFNKNYCAIIDNDNVEISKNIKDCINNNIFIAKQIIKKTDLSKDTNIEPYVGDIIKVPSNFFTEKGYNINDDYYYNKHTDQIYSINGIKYETYLLHSEDDVNYLIRMRKNKLMDIIYNLKNEQDKKLKEYQLDNGAFSTYSTTSNEVTIVPYFSIKASIALLDEVGLAMDAKKYIQWHLDNINMTPDVKGQTGTIYDYKYDKTTKVLTSKDSYDSVDSYASLFLLLIYKYYSITNDTEFLLANKDKIDLILNCLNSMYSDTRGLTITKSDYNISYLMDNCESYEGYINASKLYNKLFNNTEISNDCLAKANTIKNTILSDTLWHENTSHYSLSYFDYAYKNSSYNRLFFDKIYYPDVMCQLYPVFTGIVEPNTTMGKHLYFLHSYYAYKDNPLKWYTYDRMIKTDDDSGHYPHMSILYASTLYLGMETQMVDGYSINFTSNIEKAFTNIYNIFNSDNDYVWEVSESGSLLSAIDNYIDYSINKKE